MSNGLKLKSVSRWVSFSFHLHYKIQETLPKTREAGMLNGKRIVLGTRCCLESQKFDFIKAF